MVLLSKAFKVSLAKSQFKNQSEFCAMREISASTLQPMKKDSDQCQWGTIVKVANKLGLSVTQFLENGK